MSEMSKVNSSSRGTNVGGGFLWIYSVGKHTNGYFLHVRLISYETQLQLKNHLLKISAAIQELNDHKKGKTADMTQRKADCYSLFDLQRETLQQ